jgi:hypothetical protein
MFIAMANVFFFYLIYIVYDILILIIILIIIVVIISIIVIIVVIIIIIIRSNFGSTFSQALVQAILAQGCMAENPFPIRLSLKRDQKTGGSKLKLRNALPKVFLGTRGSPKEVTSGFLVLRACTLANGSHYIVLGGVATLENPVILHAGSSSHSNGLFSLEPHVEGSIRTDFACKAGGTLNDHFIFFGEGIMEVLEFVAG